MDQNKKQIIKITLIVIVVLFALYGVFSLITNVYGNFKINIQKKAYTQGVNDGVTQSVLSIFQNIQKQGYVTITAGNNSLVLAPVQINTTQQANTTQSNNTKTS